MDEVITELLRDIKVNGIFTQEIKFDQFLAVIFREDDLQYCIELLRELVIEGKKLIMANPKFSQILTIKKGDQDKFKRVIMSRKEKDSYYIARKEVLDEDISQKAALSLIRYPGMREKKRSSVVVINEESSQMNSLRRLQSKRHSHLELQMENSQQDSNFLKIQKNLAQRFMIQDSSLIDSQSSKQESKSKKLIKRNNLMDKYRNHQSMQLTTNSQIHPFSTTINDSQEQSKIEIDEQMRSQYLSLTSNQFNVTAQKIFNVPSFINPEKKLKNKNIELPNVKKFSSTLIPSKTTQNSPKLKDKEAGKKRKQRLLKMRDQQALNFVQSSNKKSKGSQDSRKKSIDKKGLSDVNLEQLDSSPVFNFRKKKQSV